MTPSLDARKNRWRDLYRDDGVRKLVFKVLPETVTPPRPLPLAHLKQERIEWAAHDAQAHDFIMGFSDEYDTVIGERGVTLSGGQRQRLAIARALLTDPRILILDDSTSAIDSATEDQIQQAINRVLERRTTFLITHP